jgi:uncharacterized protein (TIGR02246 family)
LKKNDSMLRKVAPLLLVACAVNPHTAPDPPFFFSKAEVSWELLKQRAEAFNSHDAERLSRLFSPDAQVVDPSTGSELIRGRDSIRERYAEFFRSHPAAAVDADSRYYRDHGLIVRDHEIATGVGDAPLVQWVQYELTLRPFQIRLVRAARFP